MIKRNVKSLLIAGLLASSGFSFVQAANVKEVAVEAIANEVDSAQLLEIIQSHVSDEAKVALLQRRFVVAFLQRRLKELRKILNNTDEFLIANGIPIGEGLFFQAITTMPNPLFEQYEREISELENLIVVEEKALLTLKLEALRELLNNTAEFIIESSMKSRRTNNSPGIGLPGFWERPNPLFEKYEQEIQALEAQIAAA